VERDCLLAGGGQSGGGLGGGAGRRGLRGEPESGADHGGSSEKRPFHGGFLPVGLNTSRRTNHEFRKAVYKNVLALVQLVTGLSRMSQARSWGRPWGETLGGGPGGRAKAMPDFAIECGCAGVVCGVDEAGRGPLAGPVVAAAVILDRQRFRGMVRRELDDSKAMTREAREACFDALLRCAKIGVGA